MTGGAVVDQMVLRAWVENSCAEQGVPVQITDPVVIAAVSRLLTVTGIPSLQPN